MDTVPWSQLALACWPLWIAYAVILTVAVSNWWATR